jgi:prevent-host-death family protein
MSFSRLTPMVRTITATKAKNRFGELIKQVHVTGDHMIVEKSGIPVVAIIPVTDYQALQAAHEGVNLESRAKVSASQLGRANRKLHGHAPVSRGSLVEPGENQAK